MSNKIYVGNLPYSVTNDSLESNFAEFGTVTSAKIMMDRDSGRSKGFGFVEMHEAQQARSAIAALHGRPLGGRTLVVSEARPMQMRSVPASAGAPRNGYAGRKDNGFRSPYSTGPRQRSPYPAPVSSGGAATAR